MKMRITLLEIISGRRKGVMAGITKTGLSVLSHFYGLVVMMRNWRFDRIGIPDIQCRNSKKGLIKRASIPVISVGNLTTGGTGKTPLVIWLAEKLVESQLKPIIISRGYKALGNSKQNLQSNISGQEITGLNDEALEIEQRLPQVPHLQSPNRFQSIQSGTQQFDAEVAILDDGFQHRQLYRDLDWVLIDSTNPFGFDRLLPRGLLREPIAGLGRADAIILTRCELRATNRKDEMLKKIRLMAPKVPIAQVAVEPSQWLADRGQRLPLGDLTSQKLMAVCGIGNPDGFLATLALAGFQICQTQVFPDHHRFDQSDLMAIQQLALLSHVDAIVCTHKDWVKLQPLQQQIASFSSDKIAGSLPVASGRTDIADRSFPSIKNEAGLPQCIPLYALMTQLKWIENEHVLIDQVSHLMEMR